MTYFDYNAIREGRARIRRAFRPDGEAYGALFMSRDWIIGRRMEGALVHANANLQRMLADIQNGKGLGALPRHSLTLDAAGNLSPVRS